jgi:carboxypeptidase D
METSNSSAINTRIDKMNALAYMVTCLPDVPYDIGEMYSGLIPIDPKNESNALFFIFQPTIGPPQDEVTIFLNGGPGWSTFESFFQETGLFTWQPGTFQPIQNPYSWVNETNMLWYVTIYEHT